MTRQRWTVVVPVKGGADAKTRLGLPPDERREHAWAFAHDTVAAALSCSEVDGVVVVTGDDRLAGSLGDRGAGVVLRALGLNEAVAVGAEAATGPVAVLPGDLPALTPTDLAGALVAASAHTRAVVPDRAGTGTVLLTAVSAAQLRPAFGPGSATAHRAAGAVVLSGAWPSLVTDVDDLDDLAAALRLGVGPATAAAVRRSLRGVQATVSTFDPDTRCGTVLLDDGIELPFDAAAVDAGRTRFLRFGQRVRIRTEGAGADQHVTYLVLATLADPV